jgi:hypothetical protein
MGRGAERVREGRRRASERVRCIFPVSIATVCDIVDMTR